MLRPVAVFKEALIPASIPPVLAVISVAPDATETPAVLAVLPPPVIAPAEPRLSVAPLCTTKDENWPEPVPSGKVPESVTDAPV